MPFLRDYRRHSGSIRESTHAGFTIIELLIAVVIVSVLATAAFPMAELAIRRDREQELRRSLRQIREAVDAYKQAVVDGRVATAAGKSGYPPSLLTLADGVRDVRSPTGAKIYFLRRIPRDPFFNDKDVPAALTWGLRSYASSGENPKVGEDVYDVFSLSEGVGLNGEPYRAW